MGCLLLIQFFCISIMWNTVSLRYILVQVDQNKAVSSVGYRSLLHRLAFPNQCMDAVQGPKVFYGMNTCDLVPGSDCVRLRGDCSCDCLMSVYCPGFPGKVKDYCGKTCHDLDGFDCPNTNSISIPPLLRRRIHLFLQRYGF